MFTIRAIMNNAARNTENKCLREYTFPVLLCIYLRVKLLSHMATLGSPGGSDGKESACNADDPGFDPWVRKKPGRRHGNPLQCSCLENSMDRGAWRATVHGVGNSQI